MFNNPKRIWLSLIITHVVLMALFSAFRFVDWDEGFYLQAGRSVSSGLRLYFDFFHPQAPVFPQLLSNLSDGGWAELFEARAINSALSVLTMILVTLCAVRIFRIGDSHTQERPSSPKTTNQVIFLALFLYCFSGLFLSWNSAAKPLALAQFFLVSGIFLRLLTAKRTALLTGFALFGSGAALALAAQTRSPMLIALPILLIHLTLAKDIRFKPFGILAFLTGAHLAALPTLVSLAHNWQVFVYNNLGFHLSRTDATPFQVILSDKLWTLGKLLVDPQVLLVISLFLLGALLNRSQRVIWDWLRRPDLLIGFLGLALFILYFRAHPSLRQYFVQSLPLLIIFISAKAPTVSQWLDKRFTNKAKNITRSALAIYALTVIPYSALYFVTPREYDQKGLHSRMSEVVSIIQANSEAGNIIFAESAIYPALAERQPLPRTEFVGFQYHSLKLGESYGLMNLPDTNYLYREVSKRIPTLVITDFEPDRGLADRLENNYELIFSDSFANVYKRKSDLK